MAAATLPEFIVIKSYYHTDSGNAYYKDDGSVVLGEDSVFSTTVKIAAERAASSDSYVNLRFCYSNKYWQKNANDSFIVAQSKQPEEDTSKSSCTLFEAIKVNDAGVFYLTHVQSGGRLRIDDPTLGFYVDENPTTDNGYLTFVDWDTLVKFNTNVRVAFKGDNGLYLKAYNADDLPYLQFGSNDPNDVYSGHQVKLIDDGNIGVYSEYWGKFWRLEPNWVRADSTTAGTNDINTLFWPVKIDDNTVALRSVGSNMFCKRLNADGKTSFLNASDPTITEFSRMQVQELVSERKIYNVRYRIEDGRIFDEKPYVAGTSTLTNIEDEEASMSISITFQNEVSYSFSRSLSLTAGVTTTIEAGLVGIEKASIALTFQISGTLEWNNTTTTTTSVTATGTVPVPARSTVSVNYVGTQGTCNVPFHYTQEDKSSKDGIITQTDQIDGIYTNVNCYDFSFVPEKAQPL